MKVLPSVVLATAAPFWKPLANRQIHSSEPPGGFWWLRALVTSAGASEASVIVTVKPPVAASGVMATLVKSAAGSLVGFGAAGASAE